MRRIVSVGIVVVLLQLMSPGAQAAPRLQCGAVITRSTTLKADLTCPTGTALQVESDGPAVVLDLGGHRLRGSGTATGIVASRGAGSGAITVRHGSVTGFSTGISLDYAAGSRVEDVTVVGPGSTEADSVGVRVFTSPTFVLDDVSVKGFARGLQVWDAGGGQVRSSTFSGNATAVLLTPSVLTFKVVRSRVRDNLVGFRLSQSAMTLVSSRVTGNDTGISLFQSGATVRRTTVADNGTGIYGSSNDSNISLSDSTVRDNGTGVRLVRFGLRDADNVIEDSTFKDNSGPGLVVDVVNSRKTSALRISGNRFLDNGDTPVDVGVPGVSDQGAAIRVPEDNGSVLVADNDARRNGGTGIDAVGVTDGGGNTARGNDGPSQCSGVVCHR
jgi:nitrous oxidase accessory protein NosD